MIIEKKYLEKNKYTRVGWHRQETKAIVLHWTATPGASALGVRNWFNRQANELKPSYASAHYVVGLEGEIIECVPPNEYCRHVGSRTYTELGINLMVNGRYKTPSWTCIGVELCHPDDSGKFIDATLLSTQMLVKELLYSYGLNADAVTTHKAVVGWKNCPKWFCDHPEDLKKFILTVEKLLASRRARKVTEGV